MKRRIIIGASVIAICLGVLVTRAIWEGRSALSRGDQAHEAGDTEEAIRSWRRAARWYVPFAPHVEESYERLEALALAAEEAGDEPTAMAAWRGVRSSVWATRSFYTPHEERLGRANQHLKTLMARNEDPRLAQGQNLQEREAWHYELLAADSQPSLAWTLIALLGMVFWIGGGFLFAWRGIDREDRLVPKAALYSGVAVVAGLLFWVTGLHNA